MPGRPPRSRRSQARHDPARPDLVLFNGGVLESTAIRDRLISVIESWFTGLTATGNEQRSWSPTVMQGDRRDQAVARGAAYFGMTRRGSGVRIAANLARTYYLELAGTPTRAVCIVPGRAEAGERFTLDSKFSLLLRRPVEFRLLVSSIRLTDEPGQIFDVDLDAMRSLPPLKTVIRAKSGRTDSPPRDGNGSGNTLADESVTVRLVTELTEIGTLRLAVEQVDAGNRWSLHFDIRAATATDQQAQTHAAEFEGVTDDATWNEVEATLTECFVAGRLAPKDVIPRLGEILDLPRDQWPAPLLRRICGWLIQHETCRGVSPAHEARWLNLVGFSLRPGFGVSLDDWRVAEVWRTTRGKLLHAKGNGRAETLVLWRRIAGGLTDGQQQAVAAPHIQALTATHRRMTSGRGAGAVLTVPESVEVWRLVGLRWKDFP